MIKVIRILHGGSMTVHRRKYTWIYGFFAVKYMSIDKYEYDGYGGMTFTLYGDIMYEEYSIYRLLSMTCKY